LGGAGHPGCPAVRRPATAGGDNAFFLLRNRARRFIVPVDAATLHLPLDPPHGARGPADSVGAGRL